MDKLTQIEAFVATADRSSLAAAGLVLKVTPAMVGRRIDALERALGVRLLHRSTRRLVLTEEGSVYLEHCQKLLSELQQAESAISEGRHKATGHLIVSAPAAFGRKHVAPYAPAFLRDHPQLKISFNLTDGLVDLVREGYDMGIRIGGSIDPSFVAIRLASNKRVVCGTPDYFRRHGKPSTIDDLAKHNCLAFNLQGGQQRGWYFQVDGKTVAIRPVGNLDCNDGELLHRWMSEGLGLAWRSEWEIQKQLQSGLLETVLDDYALPDYDIMAVYPQQRNVPAKVRLFAQYLKAVYARPDYWSSDPDQPLVPAGATPDPGREVA